VAFAIAVSLAASAGRAAAECGDYVTILNGSGSSGHQSGTRSGHDAVPGGTPTPAPAKPPCHGPNCSGSPAREAPPLAPVAPTGTQAKELTQHLGPVNSPDAEPGSAFDRDITSHRPIRRASSVFHPPRLG
jgi:hypothetical protein